MSAQEQLEMLLSARAFDSTGTKIGEVRQVYLDDSTGRATFATVSTGIFSADAIVPLFGARLLDGELHLDHTRSSIKSSPRFDHTEDSLTPEQELDLLEHFGIEAAPLDGADSRDDADTAAVSGAPQTTDDAEQAEPGTIPARRLASVEEPRDTPEPEVDKDKGKDKAKAKDENTDKAKAGKAATAATSKATAVSATTGAAATTAKQGAKQGDKQTGKAEAADKPAVQARDKATAKAADKTTAAATTARKTVATTGDTAGAADKPAAPATGSLASKLAATAKQAGRDDDSARPSSIEKAAETTTGTDAAKDATKDTSAPSDAK